MRYFFYGEECPHCHIMMPIIDQLIKEGVAIEKCETWHNKKNAAMLASKDTGICGGVPFFFNEESGKSICGEASEAEIRTWAEGK